MQRLLREAHEKPDEAIYPICFSAIEWKQHEEQIRLHFPFLQIRDTVFGQLTEVYALRNPGGAGDRDFTGKAELYAEEMINKGAYNYMLYPWLNTVVTLLKEDEFVEVRTSRNRYKITAEEQSVLSGKTIGIVGLSVGQSMAVSIAMERIAGTLRIADFDTMELSNLNRLRSGVAQLGLAKSTITAREIAEIDPYIKVEVFADGVTPDNIDDFLSGLDMLVDECDGFQIKTALRFKARALKLPVLMDTSDRGMIDVERFDIEDQRPVFHGLVPETMLQKKDLLPQQILGMLFTLVGGAEISPELAVSFFEFKNSINTWPQLASSVMMGAGIGAVVARRILLGHEVPSGRWFHDVEREMTEPDKYRLPAEGADSPPKPGVADIVENILLKLGNPYFLAEIEGNMLTLQWNPKIVVQNDASETLLTTLVIHLLKKESTQNSIPVFTLKFPGSRGETIEIRPDASVENDIPRNDNIFKRIPIAGKEKQMLVQALARQQYDEILTNGINAKTLAAAGVFPPSVAFLLQRADVLEQLAKLPADNAIFLGIMQHFTRCDLTAVRINKNTKELAGMLTTILCEHPGNSILLGEALPSTLERTFVGSFNDDQQSHPFVLLKTSTN
jgi:molybdopterin/thiamine biosynthesis adenylyltransferase